MSDHRVLDHLGLQARDYDSAIRTYIPHYEEMIATVVALARGEVIDLGTGTGALAEAILHASPTTRVKLVDIDPAMLEAAGARVGRYGERAELVKATFEKALAPCDAVVASLALHHVAELAKKRALYKRIHDALRPGGVLLVADITVHDDGKERDRMYDAWSTWMTTHGIARTDAEALFVKWAKEDCYHSLATELALLGEAGFERPECFWKLGPSTVFGGYR
jgi:tRNA (cmo5U34)-methyltransferase